MTPLTGLPCFCVRVVRPPPRRRRLPASWCRPVPLTVWPPHPELTEGDHAWGPRRADHAWSSVWFGNRVSPARSRAGLFRVRLWRPPLLSDAAAAVGAQWRERPGVSTESPWADRFTDLDVCLSDASPVPDKRFLPEPTCVRRHSADWFPGNRGQSEQLEGVIATLLASPRLKGNTSKPRVTAGTTGSRVCEAHRTLPQFHPRETIK